MVQNPDKLRVVSGRVRSCGPDLRPMFSFCSRFFVWLFILALLTPQSAVALSGIEITYGGRLAEIDGRPVSGPVEIVVDFFQTRESTQLLGDRYRFPDTPLLDGVFSLLIRITGSDSNVIFGSSGELWIQITDVTNQRTYPRQRLSAVPYAVRIPVDDETLHFDSDGKLAIKNADSLVREALSPAPPLRYAAGSVVLDQAGPSQDGYLGHGDWSTFNSKQPPGSYLTSLQGDVNASGPGLGTATLSDTGVQAGIYSKIEVDAKGRAIRGLPLLPSDIPPLDATLVTSGQLGPARGGTGASLAATGGSGHFLKQETVGGVVSVGPIARSELPPMVGDSGAGGEQGAVPAPAIGDAAAGRFLKADGTWTVPTPNWGSPGPVGATTPNSGKFTHLTTSGNLGVGTVTPTEKLDVAGRLAVSDGISINYASNDSTGGALSLTKKGDTGDSNAPVSVGGTLGTISFGGWDGLSYGRGALITSKATESFNATGHGSTLEFFTTEAGTSTDVLRMTIAADGNVGIGSDHPTALLDVNGAVRASSFISSGGTSNFASQGVNNVGSLSIGTSSRGSDLFFGSGSNRAITVQQSTSNGHQLTIQAGASATSAGTPFNGGDLILASGSASGGDSKIQLQTANGGAPVTSMTILGNGNVGIGISSPGSLLQVNGGAAIGYSSPTIAPADGLVVSSNVGIGTTSPSAPLDIAGEFRVGAAPSTLTTVSGAHTASVTTINVFSSAGYPKAGTILIGGEAIIYTGKTDTTFTGCTRGAFGTAPVAFAGGDTVDIYLSTFRTEAIAPKLVVTAAGNVGIGSLSPSAVLDVSGKIRGSALDITKDAQAPTTAAFGDWQGNGQLVIRGASNSNKRLALGVDTSSSTMAGIIQAIEASVLPRSLLINPSGGNVGIGTTNAVAKFVVNEGQAVGSFTTNATNSIDWHHGNMQATSAAPGTIALSNMLDGASYTLILTNGTAGNYTLSSTNTTFKCNPACPVQALSGKDTIVTMVKGGSTVWVSWTPGFQ